MNKSPPIVIESYNPKQSWALGIVEVAPEEWKCSECGGNFLFISPSHIQCKKCFIIHKIKEVKAMKEKLLCATDCEGQFIIGRCIGCIRYPKSKTKDKYKKFNEGVTI